VLFRISRQVAGPLEAINNLPLKTLCLLMETTLNIEWSMVRTACL